MEGDLLNAQPLADVDYSRRKITFLAALGVFLAFVFSYTLSRLFLDPSPLMLAYVSIVAALFLVVVFLESVLIKEFSRLASFLFFNTLALASMFVLAPSVSLFIGSFLAFLFFLWGAANGRQEIVNSLRLRIAFTASFVMPKAVTALSLFIAAAYIGAIQHSHILVSRNLFLQLVLPTESVVDYLLPGVTYNETTREAIQKYSENVVARNPEANKLSEADRTHLADSYATDFKNHLREDYFKVDLRDNEPVIDLLYRAFTAYIANIPTTTTATYASLIFALILFLVIRSIGTPFYYVVIVFAVLIYQLLRASGFLVVALDTRSKEILILK
jgi:hypothetical protein